MKIHFLLIALFFLESCKGMESQKSEGFKARASNFYTMLTTQNENFKHWASDRFEKIKDFMQGPDKIQKIKNFIKGSDTLEELNNALDKKEEQAVEEEYQNIEYKSAYDLDFPISDIQKMKREVIKKINSLSEAEKTDMENAKIFIKTFANAYGKYYENVVATFAMKYESHFIDLLNVLQKIFFDKLFSEKNSQFDEFNKKWRSVFLKTDRLLLSNLQNSNITFQNIASPLSLDKAKKEFPDVYGLGSENVIFLGSIINDYIKSFFSKTLHVDFSIKDENLFQKSVESDIVKFLNGKMFGNTKKDTKIESIFEMNDTLKMRILTARVVSLTLRNVLIKKFLLENVHFEDLPKDTVQKNPKLIAAVKKIMEVYPATCNDVVIDAFLAGNKSYDLFSDYISQVIENNMSDLSQSEKNIFVALFLNGSLFKNASSYTKTIDLEALYFFRKGIGFLENQAKQFDKLIKQYFESKPQDV